MCVCVCVFLSEGYISHFNSILRIKHSFFFIKYKTKLIITKLKKKILLKPKNTEVL